MELASGESKIGRLNEVLYVPTLAYNLLSVAKVTEAGKTVTFGETQGKVIDGEGEVATAAFLNGHLEEEVFIKKPEGFVVEGKEHLVCKLKQSLYGLKQSPRCWNSTLDAHMKGMGYVQCINDPCIYTSSGGESTIIGVYVDDFVIAGENSERIEQVKTSLSEKFDVKDLGELHYFLGVQVVQDHKRGTVWMGQPTFTEFVLQKYNMSEAKSVKTPVSVNSKQL